MSHEWHAKQLLAAIRDIDDFVVSCVDDGAVPLLDAVETSRLLKALIREDAIYEPSVDSARRRLARMRLGATAHVIGLRWEPKCSRCKLLVERGASLVDAMIEHAQSGVHI